MGKETLSVRQANIIIKSYNDCISASEKKMEEQFNHCLHELSLLWEDNGAVQFAETLNKGYTEVLIVEMNKNNKAFQEFVRQTAERYIRVGNMSERVTEEALTLTGEIDTSIIKPYFSGDTFGAMGTKETDLKPYMLILEKLITGLKTTTGELQSELLKINAFGNQDVQLCITKLAGNYAEFLSSFTEEVKNFSHKYITEIMTKYKKISDNLYH